MKNVMTHQQEIELSAKAKTSVFISDYSKAVQITLRDKNERNETHIIELEIPIDLARNLICELVADLADHDEKKDLEKAAATDPFPADTKAEEL